MPCGIVMSLALDRVVVGSGVAVRRARPEIALVTKRAGRLPPILRELAGHVDGLSSATEGEVTLELPVLLYLHRAGRGVVVADDKETLIALDRHPLHDEVRHRGCLAVLDLRVEGDLAVARMRRRSDGAALAVLVLAGVGLRGGEGDRGNCQRAHHHRQADY